MMGENTFLWSCVWQGTVCVGVGLVGSFILRRRPARAHQMLLLAMIAAVIVPVMSTVVKHFEWGMFVAEPVVSKPVVESRFESSNYEMADIGVVESVEPTMSVFEEAAGPVVIARPEKAKLRLGKLAIWGWAAASLILYARLLVTFALGIRLLGRSAAAKCERIQKAADAAVAKLGIDKAVVVCSSKKVRSPVIWCWGRRPVLLVPGRGEVTNGELDWVSILCHELAHWKRRDHISGLLAELVVCVMPWNPLLWLAKQRLLRLSEQACDDWVVAAGQPSTDYAESLLDLAPQGQMAFAPAVLSSKSGLRGRVQRILQDKCGNPRNGMLWAVAVSIVAVVVVTTIAFAQSRPEESKAAVVPVNLQEGLVLYYSFDEDEGRKVTDLSGKGNHGRVCSGTYTQNGKIGRAMYFNGDGDYIDIGDDSSIQTDVFTLTAWIKTNDTREDCQPILSFAHNSYVVRVIANGDVLYVVSRQKVGGSGTTDVRTGQWVFVAVTRDSDSEGSIYVNGKLENSFRCDVVSRFTYTGKIGGDYAHREYFHGSIDEVRIYNRALSTSEVERLYTSTNQPDTGSATAKDIRIDRDRPLGQINVTGTARDEKGKAVSDALVTLLPGGRSKEKEYRTDTEGRFYGHYSLRFDLRDIYINSVYVLARHKERNLAAAVRIPKSSDQKLEITLAEPATLTGRISDPDGNPIRQASVHVWFGDGSQRTFFGWNDAGSVRGEIAIDDKGSFEIKSVPHGCFYAMKVKAEGYGVKVLEVGTWDTREKFIDLGRIILAPANLSVSGVVVNENGKPVANADISLYGKGQAWSSEWSDIGTDAKGNFRIRNLCPGTITIWACVEGVKSDEQCGEYLVALKQGKLHAKAGEEDVRVVVKDVTVRKPETPKPLIGKKLPHLQGININFDSEQAKDKRLLICFFRMGQGKEAGESRNCLMKLVHMAEELDKKDIRVFVVYDSRNKKSLADLKSSIPFPVGIFEGEIEKVGFKWGLRGWWPRAILTDRDHTVISEGGGWQVIRELDKKLKANEDGP